MWLYQEMILEKYLGYDGGALMNRIGAFEKKRQESSLCPLCSIPYEITRRRRPSSNQEADPRQTSSSGALILDFPAPPNQKKKKKNPPPTPIKS